MREITKEWYCLIFGHNLEAYELENKIGGEGVLTWKCSRCKNLIVSSKKSSWYYYLIK